MNYTTADCFCVNGHGSVNVSEFSARGAINTRNVFRLYGEGSTIILNRVHLYHEPLATLCDAVAREFSAPCQANIYLTPPNSQGFKVHYDTHDVFIIQLSGAKRWRTYLPALDLPLASQGSEGKNEENTEITIDHYLQPGQVLYIPRGWLHEAYSVDEHSLHITLGVFLYTWSDLLLEHVSHCALNSSTYRTALPLDFLSTCANNDDIRSQLVGLFEKIVDDIDIDLLRGSFAAQLRTQHQYSTHGLLSQINMTYSITDDTLVRATGKVEGVDEAVDGAWTMYVPSGAVTTSGSATAAARLCLTDRPIRVGDLEPILDGETRRILVRRLVVAEALEIVERSEHGSPAVGQLIGRDQ